MSVNGFNTGISNLVIRHEVLRNAHLSNSSMDRFQACWQYWPSENRWLGNGEVATTGSDLSQWECVPTNSDESSRVQTHKNAAETISLPVYDHVLEGVHTSSRVESHETCSIDSLDATRLIFARFQWTGVTAAILRWEMNAERVILLAKHVTRQSAMPLVVNTDTDYSQRSAFGKNCTRDGLNIPHSSYVIFTGCNHTFHLFRHNLLPHIIVCKSRLKNFHRCRVCYMCIPPDFQSLDWTRNDTVDGQAP
jgi:hypothetical protein